MRTVEIVNQMFGAIESLSKPEMCSIIIIEDFGHLMLVLNHNEDHRQDLVLFEQHLPGKTLQQRATRLAVHDWMRAMKEIGNACLRETIAKTIDVDPIDSEYGYPTGRGA